MPKASGPGEATSESRHHSRCVVAAPAADLADHRGTAFANGTGGGECRRLSFSVPLAGPGARQEDAESALLVGHGSGSAMKMRPSYSANARAETTWRRQR